jgi:hypothetical protein
MSQAPTLSEHRFGMTSPAADAVVVTPDDDTDLATPARSLHIGTAGDLEVITYAGTSAVVIPNVQAGIFPLSVKRVLDTNTTASDIIALY